MSAVYPAAGPAATRTCRWRAADGDYDAIAGLLEIAAGKNVDEYLVSEFPAGFPGRGFVLAKVGEGMSRENGYDVFL